MIIVDDEAISPEEAQAFSDMVLDWKGPQWVFTPVTNYVTEIGTATIDSNTTEAHQMVSMIGPNHPLRQTIVKMITKLTNKHGIKMREVGRIKLNLLTTSHESSPDQYHMPHVDTDGVHNVFLYYLNDCDGDTFLFNETYSSGEVPDTYTINQRISPKMGRCVMFSGEQYHASSSPTKSAYRCILNVDFM